MDGCPMDFTTLLDYHEGRADAATVARVREHLAGGCASCERHLAWLGRALGALRASEGLTHAPDSARERARALFRERYQAPARPPLLARLVFDSRSLLTPAALATARGEEDASVQLLFSTAEHDIDLWQERQSDRSWYLIGQVLPKGGDEGAVVRGAVLTGTGGETLSAVPEAGGGEFHLPAVPPGRYLLRLDLAEGNVLVPDVVVGQ